MQAINTALLKQKGVTVKFILNDDAITFFPVSQQHRDLKVQGLSYEDDYRGKALAGLITPTKVEIRFHRVFSDERVQRIWSRVLTIPKVANADLGKVYYQGREMG